MGPKHYPSSTDEALWILISLDDQDAFEELYQRYWSKMFQYAFNILKNQEASSDVVQEVFLDLWSKRHQKHIEQVSGYLYAMVRFSVFKHIRQGNMASSYVERINKILFVNETEQMVNFAQLEEIYAKSIEALPDRCREVFVLSREKHMTVKEIAVHLAISPKTVENQISKALKSLRIALKEIVLFLVIYLIN